ncbi:hypothetical protein SAMN04490192_3624 [Pseudomonas lundensis]|nr:hypothetical protein SAMN04490192_3624 [Pseudomonas lundensis]
MHFSIIAIAKTMNYAMFISRIPMLTLCIRYRFFCTSHLHFWEKFKFLFLRL